MFISAIIAAGGHGSRLGSDIPKQFLHLGSKSVLQRSIEALAASPLIDELIVALPAEHLQAASAVRAWVSKPLRCIEGGARRQDSVANAFATVDPRTQLVVVHDAARPFVSEDVIARTVQAADASGAAIAAVAAQDTIKRASMFGEKGRRFVEETLGRDTIFMAQTPQAFRREVLARALEVAQATDTATDEASLAELAGFAVQLVEGDVRNIKITTMADLDAARARVDTVPERLRVGHGYDLHRLAAGRQLILGGVVVPFERGLDGHSDADVVCHAVTDALLGAAGAGDIGRLFPNSDPRWKDADSLAMLRSACRRVNELGFRVSNVDVTVIAEAPKLLPYLATMRANLADVLECNVEAVSVKGKTNEGVDSTGRGESMACHAVALLTRA